MATALDLLLVDQFTAGINAPGPLDDGKMARVAVDDSGRANLEYVSITVGLDGANVKDCGAIGNGTIDDSAAISSAFASGEDLVYFPPGTYKIGANITASAAGQSIRLAPGADLTLAAGVGITFSGARQRIYGLSYAPAASSATFNAVTISGASTRVYGLTQTVSADVPNCTLLKVTGDRVSIKHAELIGSGKAFKYAIQPIASGGTESTFFSVDGYDADVGDDGANCTYGALIYSRCKYSTYRGIALVAGGRSLFPDGVVILDSHFNTFEDPQIAAPKAQYGLYLMDGAEFCYVRGGWIQGVAGSGWLANSEGVRVGHNCDHLSLKDLSSTGWDYGLGFHGNNLIPNLDGFDPSNNQTAGILLDTKIGTDEWIISGLSMTGCYGEDAAASSQPVYLWAKTGAVLGFSMTGCTCSYSLNAIKIENSSFTGGFIAGNRFINSPAGSDIIAPNATTDIFFGKNDQTSGSTSIASGPNAARVRTAIDSSTTSLTLTSLTLGSGGTAVTKYLSDTYTANFGTVNANSEVALEFNFSGVAATDALFVTYPNALLGKTGIVYKAGITSANHFGITAVNVTGSNITSVSGDVRVSVIKH